MIEHTSYFGGELRSRLTCSYDQYGHLSEWRAVDRMGEETEKALMNTDVDGIVTEKSVWYDGRLSYQHTFDPETTVSHFTSFDSFGQVKLTWIVVAEKLASFWESPDLASKFGDNFTEDRENGDLENYSCQNDDSCAVSSIHFEYLDPKKRNPLSAEWRDSEGNLLHAVYYDYEVDSFRNWTRRRVWVWSPDLSTRSLYETDYRTITYWRQ